MKATISLGLCVVLGVSFVSGCAHKSTVQAAARAALAQQSNEPDNSRTPPTTRSGYKFGDRDGATRRIRDQCKRDGLQCCGDFANCRAGRFCC